MVSLLSLAVVFYFADLGEMVQALRLADYRLVLAALGLAFVWLAVRSLAWRTLLQEQATYPQVFFTITEGYLLNNVLPFRLGEVGRAFLLGQKANLAFWQVFSTIIIERVLDLALAAGLLLSTLPFVVGATWAREAAWITAGLVTIGLALLYALARSRDWAVRRFAALSERWPFLRRVGAERLLAFFSGLGVLTRGRRFLLALAWVTLDWGIAAFQYYVLLLAFFPGAHFLWAAFSLGVGALGIAAPSSPGAVGVLELSLVGSLALFGLDPSVSLAFAVTTHLFNYVINGLLGAYALARDGQSLTGLYDRIRRVQASQENV